MALAGRLRASAARRRFRTVRRHSWAERGGKGRRPERIAPRRRPRVGSSSATTRGRGVDAKTAGTEWIETRSGAILASIDVSASDASYEGSFMGGPLLGMHGIDPSSTGDGRMAEAFGAAVVNGDLAWGAEIGSLAPPRRGTDEGKPVGRTRAPGGDDDPAATAAEPILPTLRDPLPRPIAPSLPRDRARAGLQIPGLRARPPRRPQCRAIGGSAIGRDPCHP